MDDFAREIIAEALEVYREALSGGIALVAGLKARQLTEAERELRQMKLRQIEHAKEQLTKENGGRS